MNDAALLALHREIVSIPSVSKNEAALADHLERVLRSLGADVERLGDNLVARAGEGPYLALVSHLDTVPPSPAWTKAPHVAEAEDGKVYGLGSNDAKASVAAMVAAFARLSHEGSADLGVMLVLVVEEETTGKGADAVVAMIRERGIELAAVIVGEPTGLDVAVAQKGLLILELKAAGKACHAAHGKALGAPNAIRRLARDLVALEGADLGADHPLLGPVTLEPTVVAGGTARNMVPGEASCVFDVRTNPTEEAGALVGRLREMVESELVVLSDRLVPCEIDAAHPLVRAACSARQGTRTIGSRGLSDLVAFARAGIPGIKVGPGLTERSHTPDEFVFEREIVEGAHYYTEAVRAFATLRAGDAPARSRQEGNAA